MEGGDDSATEGYSLAGSLLDVSNSDSVTVARFAELITVNIYLSYITGDHNFIVINKRQNIF